MHITIQRKVIPTDEEGKLLKKKQVLFHKEYESTIIPHKGDYIVDEAFSENTAEVIDVSIDYEKNECQVSLKEQQGFETIDKEISVYKKHNWE